MVKTSRFVLTVVGRLLLVGFIIIVVAALTGNLRRPILWELSPGYRGWVVVEYQRRDCPPLSTEGIQLVITVSASGHACTSSPIPKGWRYERYEYVLENGTRREIPSSGWDRDSEITPLDSKKRLAFLFVGNQQELNNSWGNRPDR
jgi:hypothetical protein